MNKLFSDLKTDEEKSNFFLSGRGYETGVIAPAIQNDVAMAYHQCAEYEKEVQDLRDVLEEIINCPQSVDEATIPAGGVEVNPAQVILTMSVSLVRIRKARAALASMGEQK